MKNYDVLIVGGGTAGVFAAISAEIPFGALMPKNSERIFVGGRCISSDRDANSALRVQATAMATGQVAGCGAYLKSVKNTVDINELKATLKNERSRAKTPTQIMATGSFFSSVKTGFFNIFIRRTSLGSIFCFL